MQSKTAQELKFRLRKKFGDKYSIQWSDTILDNILIESQREYAILSGSLTGRMELTAGISPVTTLPDDFIKVIRILDADGGDVPVVSYRKLNEDFEDFRKRTGNKAEAVCFNFDGYGKCRIFPVLPENTHVGTLIYSRLPDNKTLEVKNLSAVEQYALFMMFQFTGKKQAQNCYAAFIELTEQEKRHRLFTGDKYIARTGVYF
jgi:hypothetical protein